MMREHTSAPRLVECSLKTHFLISTFPTNRMASLAVRSGRHTGIYTDNDQKIEAVCLLTDREL